MEEKNYVSELTESVYVGNKKQHVVNFTFFVSLVLPFLFTSIYFILAITGNLILPSWVNWLMLIIILPSILASLVISQKKDLIGSYGETVTILIPTFVWLLAGQTYALKWLIIMSFVIILTGVLSFLVGFLFMRKRINPSYTRIAFRKLLIRIGFISGAVVSTVVISVALLNWADNSAHFAGSNKRNYTSHNWIIFVAMVTIFIALLLVSLGLVAYYQDSNTKGTKISFIKISKSKKFMNKTMAFKVKKRRRKWFKRFLGRF